jgi:hypothetical protein
MRFTYLRRYMFLQTTHGEDIWSSPFHVGGAAEYDSTSWSLFNPQATDTPTYYITRVTSVC